MHRLFNYFLFTQEKAGGSCEETMEREPSHILCPASIPSLVLCLLCFHVPFCSLILSKCPPPPSPAPGVVMWLIPDGHVTQSHPVSPLTATGIGSGMDVWSELAHWVSDQRLVLKDGAGGKPLFSWGYWAGSIWVCSSCCLSYKKPSQGRNWDRFLKILLEYLDPFMSWSQYNLRLLNYVNQWI